MGSVRCTARWKTRVVADVGDVLQVLSGPIRDAND